MYKRCLVFVSNPSFSTYSSVSIFLLKGGGPAFFVPVSSISCNTLYAHLFGTSPRDFLVVTRFNTSVHFVPMDSYGSHIGAITEICNMFNHLDCFKCSPLIGPPN